MTPDPPKTLRLLNRVRYEKERVKSILFIHRKKKRKNNKKILMRAEMRWIRIDLPLREVSNKS